MHAYIHTYMHTKHAHTFTHACTCTHTRARAHTHTHTHTHTHRCSLTVYKNWLQQWSNKVFKFSWSFLILIVWNKLDIWVFSPTEGITECQGLLKLKQWTGTKTRTNTCKRMFRTLDIQNACTNILYTNNALKTSNIQLTLLVCCVSYRYFRTSMYTSFQGGRNSSVGSAWACCPQCRGFDPPLGTFSVEGIFPLELTWVQTPFPQKLLRIRV